MKGKFKMSLFDWTCSRCQTENCTSIKNATDGERLCRQCWNSDQMDKFSCAECGASESPSSWCEETKKDLIERQLCFTCNHWTKLVLIRNNEIPVSIRIDHKHYLAEPMVTDERINRWHLGHGGQQFSIRMRDDGRVVTTNNMWHQGTIPERFWDRLPDNAEWVDDALNPPVLTGKRLPRLT